MSMWSSLEAAAVCGARHSEIGVGCSYMQLFLRPAQGSLTCLLHHSCCPLTATCVSGLGSVQHSALLPPWDEFAEVNEAFWEGVSRMLSSKASQISLRCRGFAQEARLVLPIGDGLRSPLLDARAPHTRAFYHKMCTLSGILHLPPPHRLRIRRTLEDRVVCSWLSSSRQKGPSHTAFGFQLTQSWRRQGCLLRRTSTACRTWERG
jgi:hypothetical protein